MTVEPSWRINPKADDRDVFHAASPDPGGEPAMVPDTRLQAIADAWSNPPGIPEQEAIDNLGDEYPYMRMLLDALTEEPTAVHGKLPDLEAGDWGLSGGGEGL